MPVLTFLIPVYLGSIIHLTTYGIALIWVSVALGLTLLYISLQSEDIYLDPLTNLYNRNYLMHYMDRIPRQIRAGMHMTGIRLILNGILLIFVAALLVFAIVLVRTKLLQNAQSLGMALVHSYALEEEMNISALEMHFNIAGEYLDEMIAAGEDNDQLQAWLTGYFHKFTDAMGTGVADFYAVVDGKIIAANPWEGDETYPYQEAAWYRDALASDGQVARRAIYQDAITGQLIFTISKALDSENNVVAMDVYIQNDSLHNNAQILPQNSSYYLCDENGVLLYSMTKWNVDAQRTQAYIDYLMSGIADGSLLAHDATIQDPEGVTRGVYYQEMNNGWTVIMTMPIQQILMGDENTVILILSGVAVFLFLVLIFMTIQDMIKSRVMKKADDTARILGDSFYSIYRVNVKTGTYECFKLYDDLRGKVPMKGSYASLLEALRPLATPSTFQAFKANFSLDSISQRMEQGIPDYGGDYQRRFGDTYRWMNIRTLYDPELAPDEVILCFRDVDEEKRREIQHTIILQDALDAAQKSTKAKSEFFSNMSHDMRTPLNAIIGCCDLAEKTHNAEGHQKVWEYIKKIQFSADQLLNLINDILELSRMEAGKNNLDQKELDLSQLLLKLADLFQDRAQAEGKRLEINIDLQNPIVMGDEKKLTQIINNLLSNAVKYTDPGGSITLEARQFSFQQHNKYQIVVEDTGVGMSPSFLEHLFDPYSRETAFSSHPTVGTGLGMSIVKSLVQQMSGEISVDSTLGVGTRFTVTIPLKTVYQPEAEAPVSEPEEADAPFDWSGRTILAAEDNELNREIVTEILHQFGARVLTAVNGTEAVQTFLAAQPFSIDAILMDMQMPEMDGCQAAAAIRSSGRADAGGIPIVAVTANAFAEDIARTTQAGMNDHISKPIDTKHLKQILEKLIADWEAERELPQ